MPTTKPTATFKQFEVVVVPFPFTDISAAKRRPALVLSGERAFNAPSGHSVMAMITTAQHPPWPLDTVIRDPRSAGLTAPSVVRMKLFTLDHRVVLRRIGRLAKADQVATRASLRQLLLI